MIRCLPRSVLLAVLVVLCQTPSVAQGGTLSKAEVDALWEQLLLEERYEAIQYFYRSARAVRLPVAGSGASGSGDSRRTSLGPLRRAWNWWRMGSQRPTRSGSALTFRGAAALLEGDQQVVSGVRLRMDAGLRGGEVPDVGIPARSQKPERPPPDSKDQVGRVRPGRCRPASQRRRLSGQRAYRATCTARRARVRRYARARDRPDPGSPLADLLGSTN